MSDEAEDSKQCRICLDGEAPELGRLIRPCLCKGSISYVHVKCLQRWRNTSASGSAFYACPQCGYHYHFARTRVLGIATNPVVVAALSSLLFTYYWFYPVDIFRALVRMTINFFDDDLLDNPIFRARRGSARTSPEIRGPPGLLMRLFRRFLLGLPVVGAGSVAHLLFSFPMPFNWMRLRTRRVGRRSKDMVALIMLAVVIAGVARALYKVYQFTERMTKRLLLRAEDAILEVG
ncbi:zf-C3HC4-domain-containing protein [Lenzites betulinus]|nr:zf-C3HC4-domain-containing protein [Lenzites betulinus]